MSLTITVISGLYQKIDPKVRAARRKKFFGSGRRKRDAGEEKEGEMVGKEENLEEGLLLEVFDSKHLEENLDGTREGRAHGSNPESRFHAFHSCEKCHFIHETFVIHIFNIFSPHSFLWEFVEQCRRGITYETTIGSENRELFVIVFVFVSVIVIIFIFVFVFLPSKKDWQ